MYQIGPTEFRDEYLWIRDIDSDPDVKKYISKENVYTNRYMRSQSRLRDIVRNELNFDSVQSLKPCLLLKYQIESFWQDGSFVYFIVGDLGPFPVYMRVKTDFDGCFGDSVPEIVLNLNEILPRNCPFYMIGVFEVLNDLLAYSVDLVGNEKYQLYVIDLKTKNTLAGPVKDTYYSAQWKLVGTELFLYFNIVSERWGVPLAIQSIGPFSASKSPVLSSVYEEQDIAFICELYGTNDGQALFIKINDQTTSEYVEIEHTSSGIVLKPIFKRSVGVKYFVEHFQNSYVIQTNENAPNFKVLVYSKSMTLETEKVAVSDDFIEKVEVFEKYFVLWIRRNSFPFIKVCEVEGRACKEYPSEIDGKPYTLAPNFELDIDARVYRSYKSNSLLFSNSSFSQDTQLYYLNLSTMTTQWLIQVNSEDAVEYHEEQLFANSTTNFPIPISVIYPKDAIKPMPLMMIAYGAYGGFIDPSFAIEMYPFLKRGYMWAICHPRGDGDQGASWYNQGKLQHKMNTFIDVHGCITHLIETGLVDKDRIALKGRSAGGLVAGNAMLSPIFVNRPKTVIAQVPFIDPIYDLIDSTVPWTAFEWSEWGDPKNNTILEIMKQYSPYHLIPSTVTIPNTMVSCGLADPRVPYWEPIKFVAKLREFKQSKENQLLLRIGTSGHFGASQEEEMVEWITFALANT